MSTQHDSKRFVTGDQGTLVLDRARQAATAEDALLLPSTHVPESDEVLIVDGRANLGPAQHVENKLSNLLRGSLLPISHVRLTTLVAGRRPSRA